MPSRSRFRRHGGHAAEERRHRHARKPVVQFHGTLVARAIGAYQETARRARDGLLQHVNLADGLRMR